MPQFCMHPAQSLALVLPATPAAALAAALASKLALEGREVVCIKPPAAVLVQLVESEAEEEKEVRACGSGERT